MATKYRIAARIVDITKYRPQITDHLLVDTNIWFWHSYSRGTLLNVSQTRIDQIEVYIDFVDELIKAKATLFSSELSFSELAYLIEQYEREFAGFADRQAKEFRHNFPDKRQKVVNRIKSVWGQIKSVSATFPQALSIDPPLIENALLGLQTQRLDGYDFFLLEAARRNGVTQILLTFPLRSASPDNRASYFPAQSHFLSDNTSSFYMKSSVKIIG